MKSGGAKNPQVLPEEEPAVHSHDDLVWLSLDAGSSSGCQLPARFAQRIITIVIQSVDFAAVVVLIPNLQPRAQGFGRP